MKLITEHKTYEIYDKKLLPTLKEIVENNEEITSITHYAKNSVARTLYKMDWLIKTKKKIGEIQ